MHTHTIYLLILTNCALIGKTLLVIFMQNYAKACLMVEAGLHKVGIRGIQIRAKIKILGAKIVAEPKAQPHNWLSEPETRDLGVKINL